MRPMQERLPFEPAAPGGRVVVLPGALAVQERLLEELGAALAEREPALRARPAETLARPLRVVVPSQSLRHHVAAAVVGRFGSLLGVTVQTHFALALEALERAGRAPRRGAALVPALVRRHAAREPELARWLGDFEDGFGIVDGAVRDLLAPALASRARAVVRVAARVLAELVEHGLGHRSAPLASAREALETAGARAQALLPTARLWIHGFADATGLVADWLAALVRAFDARVLIDVPPDPSDPGRREARYPADLRARMEAAAGAAAEEAVAGHPAPRLVLRVAPGSAAEVRAAAQEVRALLDRGVAPESIALVARRLEPYRAALASQLDRLAIPFSGVGVRAGPDAATRRAHALVRLLEEQGAVAVDTWLAADAEPAAADPDLRVALHLLGAGRLEQVEGLGVVLEARLVDGAHLPLPVRRGGEEQEQDDDREEAAGDGVEARNPARWRWNRRRHVGRRDLEQAMARAAALLERLRAWPERAPFAAQWKALCALVSDALAWRPERPGCAASLEVLEALAREVPAGFELARAEISLLVARALAEVEESSLGGAGAGVQVLTLTAARGRCFEHLVALGLNRDVLPRAVTDDPLVPDALRGRLRVVLPEMPVRERAREEDRHLFASICTAAPSVVLSWQHVGDEGRTRPESPFVARLRGARRDLAVELAAPVPEPEAGAPSAAPRPAHEHALRAGLARARHLAPVRALALGEVREALARAGLAAPLETSRVAAAQLAALRELDRAPSRPGSAPLPPGAWFGWVGAHTEGEGGEDGPGLYVTRLEDLARCPWQAFLRRELGLAPVPDALASLPAPGPLLRGKVVHRVLEDVVRARMPEGPATLALARARGPVRVPWPSEAELEQRLAHAAREVAREEGIALPGFVAALARSVRPLLQAARDVDWENPGGPSVLGVELEGELRVRDAAGRERRVGFRADRVDQVPDGGLRLTDYKAGRPPGRGRAPASAASTRQQHLLDAVRSGRLLQAPAYWLAARQLAPGTECEGRFVFLREGLEPGVRVFCADASSAAAFEHTTRVLFDALDHGVQPPRLDVGEEEPPCSWCEVSTACLRGESGARMRLRAWIEAAAARAADLPPAERALLAVLRLRDAGARREAEAGVAGEGEA
jgi:RecB family exonuclease